MKEPRYQKTSFTKKFLNWPFYLYTSFRQDKTTFTAFTTYNVIYSKTMAGRNLKFFVSIRYEVANISSFMVQHLQTTPSMTYQDAQYFPNIVSATEQHINRPSLTKIFFCVFSTNQKILRHFNFFGGKFPPLPVGSRPPQGCQYDP